MILILCLSLLQLGFAQAAPILDRALAGIQASHPNRNSELQTEILSMALEDQTARFEIADFKNVSEEEIKHISEIAARHNLRLKEIISVYGWPGLWLD
jgi:phosphoribosylaminoimidazole-succinocarboxamide synthase